MDDFALAIAVADEGAAIVRDRFGTHLTRTTNSSRTWLIDPLCGTLNYAVKMRVAAVNVALRTGNKFEAAAVADPFNREIFWTDGAGAFLRFVWSRYATTAGRAIKTGGHEL